MCTCTYFHVHDTLNVHVHAAYVYMYKTTCTGRWEKTSLPTHNVHRHMLSMYCGWQCTPLCNTIPPDKVPSMLSVFIALICLPCSALLESLEQLTAPTASWLVPGSHQAMIVHKGSQNCPLYGSSYTCAELYPKLRDGTMRLSSLWAWCKYLWQ